MTDHHPADSDRFLESVAQYLDGNLAEDDTKRLNDDLCDDPVRRAQFVDFCIQSQLIREYGGACREDDGSPTPLSVGRAKVSEGRRTWTRVAMLSTLAAAILLAFVIVRRSPSDPAVASLSHVQGDVFVTRDGKQRAVSASNAVYAGDTIVIEGTQGRAVLEYADGTELRLDGDLSMLIESEKQLRLDAGTLTASVARQAADRPLILTTPQASVRVLGTVFSLAAATERTDVSVDEGRVRLTRTADRASVEVAQGEFAVAGQEGELVAHNMPRPPDDWSADFEEGIPPDWKRGTFETAGLPVGSRGAVRAARMENDDGVCFQIESPKKWADGIFSIHGDTHLHITFKLERPAWFQVFINTRPFDPDLPPTFLYRFKDDRLWKWSDRGRWLRATIPLTEFERVPERKGTPPLGEVPFELLFSSQGEDRGMVIDRLSISRGGPGKIVIEELEP